MVLLHLHHSLGWHSHFLQPRERPTRKGAQVGVESKGPAASGIVRMTKQMVRMTKHLSFCFHLVCREKIIKLGLPRELTCWIM